MKNLKLQFKIKNFISEWKLTIVFGLMIITLFFALRLINLTILPIFADEAIYIRWSQVMRVEPTLRFLPLSDGKQPLFMWLTIPFLKFFPDPLVAGRMVSILAGFATMVGIFLLTLQLFKLRIALLASLLYAVSPFTVFFDRMALVDSLLSMFGIWVLYFGILLTRYQRLDLAMITGMILGAALLTKSPATFFAILLPATVILLSFKLKKDLIVQLIKVVGLWSVVYFFAYGLYNIQRLGPNFQMIALRNKDYVFSLSHLLTNPLDPFQFHLAEIWQWFGTLLTWPIFLVSLAGIFLALRKNLKPALLLLLWLTVPLLVQAEFAKVFTARYILFSVPILLVFSALGLSLGRLLFWLIILIFPLYFDFLLLTDPSRAPLPRRERAGYLEEWTAGTGIKEAAYYLKEQAKTRKILVGTEGYFGTLPDGLQMYLERIPNITVVGIGLYPEKVPDSLISGLTDNEVYLLINNERLALKPEEHNLTLVANYPKAKRPNGTHQSLLLFLVKSR
ncbi:MAG: ArnT family glycosyltransferase [Patescibacteria group bacterium]